MAFQGRRRPRIATRNGTHAQTPRAAHFSNRRGREWWSEGCKVSLIDSEAALAAPLGRVDGLEEGALGAQVLVRDLFHAYGRQAPGGSNADGVLPVIRGVDLDAEPGGYLAITGVSGAGKSTLLSLLGGLERVQSGSVMVGGRDLATLGPLELARFRRAVGGLLFPDS